MKKDTKITMNTKKAQMNKTNNSRSKAGKQGAKTKTASGKKSMSGNGKKKTGKQGGAASKRKQHKQDQMHDDDGHDNDGNQMSNMGAHYDDEHQNDRTPSSRNDRTSRR